MGPSGLVQEVRKRWFILGVVLVITLAKLFPPLGAKGGRFDRLLEGTKWTLMKMIFIIQRTSEARNHSPYHRSVYNIL